MQKPKVASKLMDLYCFNQTKYRFMYQDRKTGEVGYRAIDRPYSIMQVYSHLDGRIALSVCGGEMDTVFSTFDIDEPGIANVRAVLDALEAAGVPRRKMYVSSSGNKGHHIDIFYDRPVFKSAGENLFDYIRRRDPTIAEMKFEYFPTGGRSIKLPLGVNFKSGRRCWFLDQDTLEPVEDFEYILSVEKWAADEFNELVHRINKERKLDMIAAAAEYKPEKTDAVAKIAGNYVAKHAGDSEPVLTKQGERHDKMLAVAVHARCAGAPDDDAVYAAEMVWLARQDQSFVGSTPEEVETDARGIARDVCAKYMPVAQWAERAYMRERRESMTGIITSENLGNILLCKKRSVRLTALLICVYTSCFGSCRMGYDMMAERIGVARMTVVAAVKELINMKIIKWWKRGGVVEVNGQAQFRANEYKFTDKQLFDTWPVITKKETTFVFDDVKDDIGGFYRKLILRMVDESEQSLYLTKRDKLAGSSGVSPADE